MNNRISVSVIKCFQTVLEDRKISDDIKKIQVLLVETARTC